jgi:peptide/nickel transport system permease protein
MPLPVASHAVAFEPKRARAASIPVAQDGLVSFAPEAQPGRPRRFLIGRKFARDIPAVLGMVIVLVAIVIAVAGPWIAPHPEDAVASHLLQRLKPPSAAFPFGTDNLGRDLLSRVILGARGALEVALVVVAIAAAIGVPMGLIAGYVTGWLSDTIMRVTDVFLSLPQLVLALALAQLLKPSLESAMLALALTYWPFFTRLVFAETRRLRAALFVDALQGIGASTGRIVFMHILPNAISSVIVRATIGLGFTILVAAVLGFLGMGATPPQPDWGLTISESRNYLPEAWWYATFPGLAILLTVLGFNLLGDGLRDLFDPRLRRSR